MSRSLASVFALNLFDRIFVSGHSVADVRLLSAIRLGSLRNSAGVRVRRKLERVCGSTSHADSFAFAFRSIV